MRAHTTAVRAGVVWPALMLESGLVEVLDQSGQWPIFFGSRRGAEAVGYVFGVPHTRRHRDVGHNVTSTKSPDRKGMTVI